MKKPRKPVINPQPMDRLAKARAVGYLQTARESLGRASAALLSAGEGDIACGIEAVNSGLETTCEQINARAEA